MISALDLDLRDFGQVLAAKLHELTNVTSRARNLDTARQVSWRTRPEKTRGLPGHFTETEEVDIVTHLPGVVLQALTSNAGLHVFDGGWRSDGNDTIELWDSLFYSEPCCAANLLSAYGQLGIQPTGRIAEIINKYAK